MSGTEVLRDMVPEDAAEVARLLALGMPEGWTEGQVLTGLEIPGLSGRVIALPERLLAVLLLLGSGEEVEILQVAVEPGLRRRGLGRRLLRDALERACEQGALRVVLDVRQGNAAAIALYAAEGFQRNGRRRTYYRDGEDALSMSRVLHRQIREG